MKRATTKVEAELQENIKKTATKLKVMNDVSAANKLD